MKHENTVYRDDELVASEVRHAFNRSAKTYDSAALFQREIAQRLFERLELIRIQPQMVLDLGSGTGFCSQLLAKKYLDAKIIAVDISENMLFQAKSKKSPDCIDYVCANARDLPFEPHSIDLIFSNLFLHWSYPLEDVMAELHRVLKPGGLLLFSILGPDTFKELRQSWAAVDHKPHVHSFIDMHHVGDILLNIGYENSVMDMECVTLHYEKLRTFLSDIKSLGVSNKLQNRQKTLMGKEHYQSFVDEYEKWRTQEGLLPVTYEVIYGQAWRSEAKSNPGDFFISPSKITKRLNSR